LTAELNERVEAEQSYAEEQGKLVSEIENLRCELQERDGVCRNHINVIAELEEELETLKEEAERKDPKASSEALEANASRLSSQLAEKESTIESLRRAAEEAESEVTALKEELGLKEDELAKVGVELKKGWECLGSNSDSTSGIDSPRSVADEAVAIRQLIEEHQSELKNLYKQQELLRADLELSTNNEKEREQEVARLKDEVHKHHELSEQLRRDKEASQAEFQKHKQKVETQVKKLDELQAQMTSDHQKEIAQLQGDFAAERDRLLQQLQQQHREEIDALRKELRDKDVIIKRLQDELERTKDQLAKAKDHRIIRGNNEENDPPTPPSLSTHYHSMTPSSRLSVGELGRQLEDQIHQTEVLDRALVDRLKARSGGPDAENANSSGNESGTDSGFDTFCSSGMHLLLNRVQKEGLRVKKLTEQQKDGSSRGSRPNDVGGVSDPEALKEAWLTEKRMLLDTIASLRELLQKASDESLSSSSSDPDWRAEYLKSFTDVITKERESLLAELGSEWAEGRRGVDATTAKPGDARELNLLEKKIQAMVDHHQGAMEKLVSLDRTSLLSELNHVRSNLNRSQTLLDEEKRRNVRSSSAGPGISSEAADALDKELRELKRKVELQDFRLTQERAVATDARASLDAERAHVAEMTTRLSREKSTNNDLQSALDASRDQITRLKVALEKAQAEGETLRTTLEGERTNSRNLNNSLSREEGEISRLKAEIERERSKRETDVAKERRNQESMKRSLEDAREEAHGLQVSLEMEKSAHNEARRELGATKADLRAADAKLQEKLSDLEKNLDLERVRNGELMAALERESDEAKTLTLTLDQERQQTREEIAKQRDMISGLQASLEREKRQVADLSAALEREKITVASMAASMERNKAAAREEVEAERQAAERTRESLEAAQQETARLEEVLSSERQEFSALKTTNSLLESEVASMEEEMQRKREEREVEKQMEKKRLKELERDKQLEKDARNELEMDVMTLKRKISDLETILTENRDRELAALGGRGVATSLSASRTSGLTASASGRHLVGPGGDGTRPEEERRFSSTVKGVGSSSHANTQRPSEADADDDDLDDDETADKINPDLRSNLSRLVAKLAVEIEQMHDEQRRLGCGCASGRGESDDSDASSGASARQRALNAILELIRDIKRSLSGGDMASSAVGEQSNLNLSGFEDLMRNNEKLRGEKEELRAALSQLEEEVWQFRQKEIQPSERTDFERALRDAKTELATLRCNIESTERERRRQQQHSYAADKEKLQKLYGKYLRAESFRKALVYQKRYLLLLLGGFQDCEQATLSMIAKMGAYPSTEVPQTETKHSPAFTKFRSAVRTVIAVQRLKFLVNKWQRASTSGSRASRSLADIPSSRCSSAASSVRVSVREEAESVRQPLPTTPTRGSSVGLNAGPSAVMTTPPRSHAASLSLPTGLTPPTKDLGGGGGGGGEESRAASTRKTFLSPKLHSSSSSLRRDETTPSLHPAPSAPSLTTASNPAVVSPRDVVQTTSIAPLRPTSAADSSPSESDDYIQRLENLQQRLGRMSPACAGTHAHHFITSSASSKLH